MAEHPDWMERVERARKGQQPPLSVEKLSERLEVSRATYYLWKAHPDRHPRDGGVVERIASFLHEDPATLRHEMSPTTPPPHPSFLEAAAARDLSVQMYQQHVQALGHVLGMVAVAPRPRGVDVVVRLLTDRLGIGDDPVSAAVVVFPKARGGQRRGGGGPRRSAGSGASKAEHKEPYQYQIYVVPEELAGRAGEALRTTWTPDLLEATRRKVDLIMSGTMLPVTREHSTELGLALFRGRADLLLYPGLLDMRPPDPTGPSQPDGPDILVTGVYYAGAPDVAALVARQLGYGFSTFDQLARLQVRAGLRGLPDELLARATSRVARAALDGQSPTAGRMVWATDNPDALLDAGAVTGLSDFLGPVVLLELSEETLDYAAYRLCRVDQEVPTQEAQELWRETLLVQQQRLRDLVAERATVATIELPPEAAHQPDGSYPDAVDPMFDQYAATAVAVAERLRNSRPGSIAGPGNQGRRSDQGDDPA